MMSRVGDYKWLQVVASGTHTTVHRPVAEGHATPSTRNSAAPSQARTSIIADAARAELGATLSMHTPLKHMHTHAYTANTHERFRIPIPGPGEHPTACFFQAVPYSACTTEHAPSDCIAAASSCAARPQGAAHAAEIHPHTPTPHPAQPLMHRASTNTQRKSRCAQTGQRSRTCRGRGSS